MRIPGLDLFSPIFNAVLKDTIQVIAITFDYGRHNLKLLREDIKSKWLMDMDIPEEQLQVFSWVEFLSDFAKLYEDYVSEEQVEHIKNCLKENLVCHDVKLILTMISETLNKIPQKRFIIMLDEIGIPRAFKSSEKDGKTKYEAEFLYLSQYESINFIICIRPQAYGDQDVELNYPNDSQYQLYKRLPNRYRNTKKILEFIKYWQDYGFLDLTNEIIIDQG